ncbi:MAG TPA: TolC family protein [Steroidobacteraceae bacterium]|nr:TolC family protein [Steroidobacteraceae bacterium]HQR47753.1 TolC family protein [Steroidobacteraceae bacterium]
MRRSPAVLKSRRPSEIGVALPLLTWALMAGTTTPGIARAETTLPAVPSARQVAALSLASAAGTQIQDPRPVTSAGTTVEVGLREVLGEALAANLELRAGAAGVAQRVAALDRARARYLPVLDFDARYSVADGGRTIDFPVGDLLNPVYETLDQLLVQSGQPAAFPRVKNEEIRLLLPREQNTRLVLAQPVYEPRLGPAVEGTRQELNRVEADYSGLRSRVIRDTKQAYYEWLVAQQQVLVFDATLELARSNLAATESLYRNGRITRDLVYRAEADLLEIEQQRLAAASRVTIAQSYVNLLRNQPLTSPVPAATIDAATVERFRDRLVRRAAGRRLDAPALEEVATGQRAEIQGLDAAIAGSLAQQDLARAAFKPAVAVGAEAGIQGEDYGFGPDERYVLASVVLRWNTFRGGADLAALAEARALTDELRATRDLATQQVRLQVQRAVEQLGVAEASLATAEKRAVAAEAAFRITERKRDLGQVNQTDYIDARKTLTDAELNVNRVRTEFLARIAELEFAIGDRRAADEEPQ